MPKIHVVEQGEHISNVAARHGFRDFRTVWNHADNVELRALRNNPFVLAPGDRVAVPDFAQKTLTVATGQSHHFVVRRSTLKLRLALRNFALAPLAALACTFDLGEGAVDETTDGKGIVETSIESDASVASFAFDAETLVLRIGDLDPMVMESGVRARLFNLGYLLDEAGDDDEMRIAVEDFQADQELATTGLLDAATRAAVEQAHGS